MPKDRYRLYHVEKAKGGIALTMTAGSAVVAAGFAAGLRQPARLQGRDRALAAAARRRLPRAWRGGDDPAHPSRPAHHLEPRPTGCRCWRPRRCASRRIAPFPRRSRTGTSRASSRTTPRPPQRMQAAGLDGIEIEAYGHLLGPVLVAGDQSPQRRLRRQPGQPPALHASRCWTPCAPRSARDFIVGIRMVADEDWDVGLSRAEGIEIARRLVARRPGRLPQRHPRPHRHRCGACDGDPDPGHAGGAASRLRRRGARGDAVPGVPRRAHQRRGDRAPCDRRGQARHGRHDPRAHRRPAHRAQGRRRGASTRSGPASAPPTASIGSTRATTRCASTTRRPAARRRCRTSIARGDGPRPKVVVVGAGPAGLEAARVAAARGHDVVLFEAADRAGRPDPARRPVAPPRRADRHRRLADAAPVRDAWRRRCASTTAPRPRTCWLRSPTS